MQCDATILQCDATILKEKIIKTDTLLQKYQENSSKLKKATELCKYLKKKYEEAKLSLEVSQLENERAKFKLENIQSKHHEVEVENTRLSKELVELGEQYQKYTLEAQAEIKSLQHELKNLHKLKQCTPDTDNKVEHLEGKLKKLQLAEKNYKAKIDKLTNQQKEIYKKHREEKCILSKQIEKLESQVVLFMLKYDKCMDLN
nr:unnamed protein product [Callosobruchus chinensis]